MGSVEAFRDAQKYDLQTDTPTATRYGFRVASQHAAPMYWDLLHLDLKTAFLQVETYNLDRRVIHVQLPTDIGLPPYLAGLCTRSRLRTCGRTAQVVEPLRQISNFTWHSTNKSGSLHICVLRRRL